MVIAGGGTGGHLFPGLAIAREIRNRRGKARILFVTGRRRMEAAIITESGFDQRAIDVEGLQGRGRIRAARALLRLPVSLGQSLAILRGFSAHLVLGVGGYSSGPVCLAARMQGVPSAIHEQNSFPGLTNRLLSRVVDRIFISFEESRKHFPSREILLTGNPVREEILKVAREQGRGGGTPFTILVVGGSQGARAVSRAVVSALGMLKGKGRQPYVIHQTGEEDLDEIREAYRVGGFSGEVRPFIRDMAGAYAGADLVVGRAGAGTVSELAALGKPSILIPYPYAANRHQETNAQVLVRAGGAEMILEPELCGERLAERLERLMEDPEGLKRMGEAARAVGRPDAVGIIADRLIEMLAPEERARGSKTA